MEKCPWKWYKGFIRQICSSHVRKGDIFAIVFGRRSNYAAITTWGCQWTPKILQFYLDRSLCWVWHQYHTFCLEQEPEAMVHAWDEVRSTSTSNTKLDSTKMLLGAWCPRFLLIDASWYNLISYVSGTLWCMAKNHLLQTTQPMREWKHRAGTHYSSSEQSFWTHILPYIYIHICNSSFYSCMKKKLLLTKKSKLSIKMVDVSECFSHLQGGRLRAYSHHHLQCCCLQSVLTAPSAKARQV